MTVARRLVLLLFAMTFSLILLGGVVHTTGSSLACPDWPLCFGQVFPAMRGGVLYEHSHRLLASALGFGVLALFGCLVAQREDRRSRALLKPAALGIALVVFQAALGGLTVVLRLPTLVSTLHLATSMLFFAWVTYMLIRLSPSHPEVQPLWLGHKARSRLCSACGLVYLQIVLGAFVRHSGASMTCGRQAFFCDDRLLPVTGPQWLQSTHRGLAGVAVFAVVLGTLPVLRAAREFQRSRLRRLALSTHLLVSLQIVLGILTLKTGISLHVVTTHLALGALLWVALVALIANTRQIAASSPAQNWEVCGGIERPHGA